jgi:DNA-binding NtrC family response regulator
MKEKNTFLLARGTWRHRRVDRRTELMQRPSESGIAHHRSIAFGRALILTGDEEASSSLPGLIQQCGSEPLSLGTIAALRSCHPNSRISLLLCEERLSDGTFRDALGFLRGMAQPVPVIVFSRIAEWENYLEATRHGAYDCFRYPFRTGELQLILGRMLQQSA